MHFMRVREANDLDRQDGAGCGSDMTQPTLRELEALREKISAMWPDKFVEIHIVDSKPRLVIS